MNILRKKPFLLIVGVLLFLTAEAAYALPPRVSWIPPELKPGSVAPGESASYTLTLKHTGILPIPATNQLKVVAEGDIVPFVAIAQQKFPPVFKRGTQVNVVVNITVPPTTPLSVKTGVLVLKRILPNGKEKEVWRANALPVELTFSAISLPPDPGEEGKTTLLGVDLDSNGVRDDIDRYIVFTYPDSARKRAALSQFATLGQVFLRDFEDKAKTRANVLERHKAQGCSWFTFGFENGVRVTDIVDAQILNTPERIRAYNRADRHLGGTVSELPKGLASECSTDPNSLPN